MVEIEQQNWQSHSSTLSKMYSQIDIFNKVWIIASSRCWEANLQWTRGNEAILSVSMCVLITEAIPAVQHDSQSMETQQ